MACATPTRAARSASAPAIACDLARLALAHDAHLLGLGRGERLDLGRLLLGAGEVGLALVRLHGDRQLGLGDRRLLARALSASRSSRSFDRRLLLAVVGLDLLLGDLARAQLRQDLLDLLPPGAPLVGVPISTSCSSRL